MFRCQRMKEKKVNEFSAYLVDACVVYYTIINNVVNGRSAYGTEEMKNVRIDWIVAGEPARGYVMAISAF